MGTPIDLGPYLPDRPILTSAETAKLMGFSSCRALSRARSSGRLPIEMIQIPGRKGWFSATQAVRRWLETSLSEALKNTPEEANSSKAR